jgi:hypothetical protein
MDLSLKIKEIPKKIKQNKLAILIILIWSITIMMLVIKEYLDFFYANESEWNWFKSGGGVPPPLEQWRGPGLTAFDFAIIIIVSLIFGWILFDIKKVFYSSLVALIISCFLASIYIGSFIWYVLGWGNVLSTMEAGWSHVIYWGFLITFRAMFPTAVLFSIICSIIGAFIRELVYQ